MGLVYHMGMGSIFVLLRTFFYLLYHPFAWTYDFVAATVSLGRWKSWVRCSIPFLEGKVLEIGYGPGHLQQALNEGGFSTFGIDESRQMVCQARRRLQKTGSPICLARGLAQSLPFQNEVFDSVVATFPSEYIFDPHTLKDVRRVLKPGGRLVILPMAWITGTQGLERLAAWLFRFTGEAPGTPRPIPGEMRERFMRAGFEAQSELVRLKGSQVLVILAKRTLY